MQESLPLERWHGEIDLGSYEAPLHNFAAASVTLTPLGIGSVGTRSRLRVFRQPTLGLCRQGLWIDERQGALKLVATLGKVPFHLVNSYSHRPCLSSSLPFRMSPAIA